jgi:hypothetical protein
MQQTKTTVHLRLPRAPRWYDLSVPVCAGVCIFVLLLIALIAGRIQNAPNVQAQPTPALPVIVIRREPAPPARVQQVAQPTPDPAVYAELAALRARVAELEAHPAPQPEVVYQPVYVEQPALAVPTPTEQSYQVVNDPPAGDFYSEPPHVDPAFQQSLVGDDPNALACGGSPMCGGLTNAEAQAALDAQR